MKAILFDFDGVIVKSMESHYEGWRRTLAEYGIDMSPEELFILEGQTLETVASQIARKFNIPHEEMPRLIERKQYHYDQVKRLESYPNLIEVLQWAKEKGLKIGLVTGSTRQQVEEVLENFGIRHYFDAIVTADDKVENKPSPEPYLRAAHLLQVEPEECVVIENAPLGIRSAKNAGMKCIAITTTLPVAFLKEADVVVYDFQEVLDALKKLY